MVRFIDRIACGYPYNSERVIGYSEEELGQIERLYDIKISGNFREFLLDMGRSDGGLIGDDPIILYREVMTVRGFVLMQSGMEEEIYSSDFRELSFGKPFVFSIESETQYFYLRTASDDPERVFHYDENNETVIDTGESFVEYMRKIATIANQPFWQIEHKGKTRTVPNNRQRVICQGELLII